MEGCLCLEETGAACDDCFEAWCHRNEVPVECDQVPTQPYPDEFDEDEDPEMEEVLTRSAHVPAADGGLTVSFRRAPPVPEGVIRPSGWTDGWKRPKTKD